MVAPRAHVDRRRIVWVPGHPRGCACGECRGVERARRDAHGELYQLANTRRTPEEREAIRWAADQVRYPIQPRRP